MDKGTIQIELIGRDERLRAALQSADSNIRTFGSGVKNTFANVSKYVNAATDNIGVFGTAIMALTSGEILKKLFSMGDYMPMEKSLLLMQLNLHQTAKEAIAFKKELESLSEETGANLTETLSKAAGMSFTQSKDDILAVLKGAEKVHTALGTDFGESVDMVAKVSKIWGMSADKIDDAVNHMITARFNPERAGTYMERGILKGVAGEKFEDFSAFVGGLEHAGVTSPRVIGSIENVRSLLGDKAQFLKENGIDIYKLDPQTGKKVMKNVVEIIDTFSARGAKAKKHIGATDESIKRWEDKNLGPQFGEGMRFLTQHRQDFVDQYKADAKSAETSNKLAETMDQSWEKQLDKLQAQKDSVKLDLSGGYDFAKGPVKWFADKPAATKTAIGIGAGASVAGVGFGVVKAWKGISNAFKDIHQIASGEAGGAAAEGAGAGASVGSITGELMTSMGLSLAPALIAGGAAAGSAYVGKKVGAWQFSKFGDQTLNEMLARNNVMGGGPNSELATLIREVLIQRELKDLNINITLEDHRTSVKSDSINPRVRVDPLPVGKH